MEIYKDQASQEESKKGYCPDIWDTFHMEMKSREGSKKEEEKRDGNSLSTEKYNIQLQKSKLLFLLLLPLLLMLLFLLISSWRDFFALRSQSSSFS